MKSNEKSEKSDKLVSVRLPLDLFEQVKAKARSEKRSVSNYLKVLLLNDLEKPDLDDLTGSDARPYPVLSPEQAEAMADLIRASQKLQDVAGSYEPRERTVRNGEGI